MDAHTGDDWINVVWNDENTADLAAEFDAVAKAARLDEARWWAEHPCSFTEDCICVTRMAELEGQ